MPSLVADFEEDESPNASVPTIGAQLMQYALAGLAMAASTLALLEAVKAI